jgi:lipopolysaccharide/colanic/teichoic acid biosynthesis glycosyltransferase
MTPKRIQRRSLIPPTTRLLDIAMATILLAITLPLLLITALAIKLEGMGPVLERRECIGSGGRRFQMLKFRTTVHNPEYPTRDWAQELTQVGQVLRNTRIDALPQLVNVLRGEMSMIAGDGFSPTFLD